MVRKKNVKEKTCMDVLDFCDAACCKELVFEFDSKLSLREFNERFGMRNSISGNRYVFECGGDADSERYFGYFGFRKEDSHHMSTYLRDGEGVLKGNRLHIYRKCDMLDDDNKCIVYDTRPKMCNYANREFNHIYPKHCIYKKH